MQRFYVGQGLYVLWQNIRNVFKRSSPTTEVIEAPVEVPAPSEVEGEPEEGQGTHISSLLAAILMDGQGNVDPEMIIGQLRNVADAKSALPESRAFSLFAIGETYSRMQSPGSLAKAREVFTELIDSESKEEVWRLRALVMRGLIDTESADVSAYNNILRDMRRVFESPLLGEIEQGYVCRAYCARGFAFKKLGNYSQALSDFHCILDDPTNENAFRIAAFTNKADIFVEQGRWVDELKACLDVIRGDAENDISEVAEKRFEDCLYKQNSWDWTIKALGLLEQREGLTERERRCILRNRIQAYAFRGAEGDLKARIADRTALLKNCRLSNEEWAFDTMLRFSDLSEIGDQPTGDEAIELLEKVLDLGRNMPDICTIARSHLGPLYVKQGGEANLNKAVLCWSHQLKSPFLDEEERAATLLVRARVYASFELFGEAINDCTEVTEMGDRVSPELSKEARQLLAEMNGNLSDCEAGEQARPMSDAEVEEAIELARHHAFSPIGDGPRHGLRILRDLINNPQIPSAARASALSIRVLINASLAEVRDIRQVIHDTSTLLEISEAQPDVVASTLINRASSYVERRNPHDIEMAIEDLRRVVTLASVSDRLIALAYFNLGRLLEAVGDVLQAVDSFEHVAALLPGGDPLVLQSRIFRGNFFLELDLFEIAIAEYSAVLEADHHEVGAKSSAFHGRAYAYEGIGDTARKIADLEAGLELEPLTAEQTACFTCRHGLAMLDLATPESLRRAQRDFESVFGLEGGSQRWLAAALYGRGMISALQGNAVEAIAGFSLALGSPELEDDLRVLALIARSKAYRALEDPAFAEMELADYDTLIDFGGHLSEEQLAYAVQSRFLRFPDRVSVPKNPIVEGGGVSTEIENFFDRSEAAEAYYFQALAIVNGRAPGERSDIISNLSSALEYPELSGLFRAIAHYNRGHYLGQLQGKNEEVISDMSACIDNVDAPSDLRAMALRKRAEIYEGIDARLALADYQSVIEASDTPEELRLSTLNDRARLFGLLQDFEGAIRDSSRLLASDLAPGDLVANAAFMRGTAYFYTKRFPEAIRDFEVASTIPEASANVRSQAPFYLGLIYFAKGEHFDLRAAKREFQNALAAGALRPKVRSDAEQMIRYCDSQR